MNERKEEKKEKLNLAEQVEVNCFKMFGYTPTEITEINQVLDDCNTLTEYHMENTAAVSPETRKKMASLLIQQDLLNIEIDDLFLTALDHIKQAREVEYLKKELKVQKDDGFLKRLSNVKKEVRELLHEIKRYIEDLKNQDVWVHS